ncbi:MAG TPA: hypothetical protein VK553_10260 [Candidatus Nitrosopolaris rasttigaisensis]|nr:hypothetical protein [Candidatus Nitrosopolaris rasttigaisensis]
MMESYLIQDTTTPTQWGGLRKCWKGYKIAKSKTDTKKMEYYAKGIRNFQRELKTSVSEFPRFGLLCRKISQEFDSENYWPDSSSCAQTRKGLEDYRLQQLADPFRIEREPDLRKEQEEYFTRIRQGFVDPGSYV